MNVFFCVWPDRSVTVVGVERYGEEEIRRELFELLDSEGNPFIAKIYSLKPDYEFHFRFDAQMFSENDKGKKETPRQMLNISINFETEGWKPFKFPEGWWEQYQRSQHPGIVITDERLKEVARVTDLVRPLSK